MSIRITGTDLDQWSVHRPARGELPALVRQLIMATVQPARIIVPADEGIAMRDLDGVLTVTGDAGPFVPKGKSVWEASTNANPKGKATDDYNKRTRQTNAEARATTAFVFVTSRSRPDAATRIGDKTALGRRMASRAVIASCAASPPGSGQTTWGAPTVRVRSHGLLPGTRRNRVAYPGPDITKCGNAAGRSALRPATPPASAWATARSCFR